jgi:hypothetical protein
MTSQGSPYARFKRALASGNLMNVRAAAAELPTVPLADALQVCELLRRSAPHLYERAALRWLARLLLERPGVTLGELEQAARALQRLPDVEAVRTLRALAPQ